MRTLAMAVMFTCDEGGGHAIAEEVAQIGEGGLDSGLMRGRGWHFGVGRIIIARAPPPHRQDMRAHSNAPHPRLLPYSRSVG